ncbi:MAG: CRISPR-associated endonuclease Cas1 [Candidatus Jettenia sp.]|uniref:CRISPR-associated endonuclease Cas1 n=1 Tax=Candidatus Jettenia caeni TaxID=247490 RepID=I3IJ40_9BACT|nr:CRISPR-associated endonuclease Cas1 [Candidatus Jettenia sp. AMX1]MBC6927467.1 CRISPR-associated endonuclease Cas1 [Candidatus Jettenia sp.]GAB61735.1 CRISPR-associated protein [Candidatus Jettenia caeni]KAA0249754.1 MAG: CRISPR-associated endonuclease Cas1 [Candidatus Jettenia sp. AMX1]MCE7879150.1 CRISPR-associated endonuclease Cas1 [Candidatus Jettenia sp. AMX1]MCQ3925731.1 CRISPR-associated endonuclease Cas1 [Candidatus Jettenia sp.]
MIAENLLEQFLSTSNFLTAYRRIASKKAAGGLDGITVEEFGHRLDQHITKLQKDIRERRYIPQPAAVTYIPKFNEENEWRELGLPSVADKVVQAAMLEVVEPLAEKMFLDCSYAYRPGTGHYKAIRRVENSLNNRKKTWVVQRDIDNFFDTVDHNRLMEQFSALVQGEPTMVELVALWCRMGLVEKNGRWRNVQAGIRQGGVISPLLANLYLHPLDVFATKLGVDWIRYADDYVILGESQEEVVSSDVQIVEFLKDSLGLMLNRDESSPKHIDEGFTFLGVRFCGKERAIDTKKIKKMKKKIRWLLAQKMVKTPEEVISKLTNQVESWQRYYSFLNPTRQFSEIDCFIEKEFLTLATSKIQTGKWDRIPPQGLSFPSLIADGKRDGFKKWEGLWAQAIKTVETDDVNHDTARINHSVEKKISRKRQKCRKESGESGNLIVTTPGHFVGKRGERIVVMSKQRIVSELPVVRLSGLTLSGRGVSISGDVVELCMKKDVYIHFVDNLGKIIAVVGPPGGSSGEVSLLQITERDKEKGLTLAKMFILGKVKNQFALLKYYFKYPLNRENGFGKIFVERRQFLSDGIEKIKNATVLSDPETFRQQMMGWEGAFGAAYWEIVGHLFRNGVQFSGRVRHGATDLVNSALNYGYGILYGDCLNAVIRTGLNPMAGFLHSYQTGKPTLIYDLIEEFRPFAVDRGIFTMLNRGERLEQGDDGMLATETRKKISKSVISRLSNEVWFHGRRLTLREVIQEQAYNIKRHLSDKAQYHPFLGRW